MADKTRDDGWKFSQAYVQKKYPRLKIRLIRGIGAWEMTKIEDPNAEPRVISVKRDRDQVVDFATEVLRAAGVTDGRLGWEKTYYCTLDKTQGRSDR